MRDSDPNSNSTPLIFTRVTSSIAIIADIKLWGWGGSYVPVYCVMKKTYKVVNNSPFAELQCMAEKKTIGFFKSF